MNSHRFRVGQMVDFIRPQGGAPASERTYRILRLLPYNGGEQLYRIKTITEALARVAKESELVFESEENGRLLQFCAR